MTPPSFAPVRALSTFVGSWISAHFLNPLILGFIDLPMTVFLYKISGPEALIGRDCHDHQDDKKTGEPPVGPEAPPIEHSRCVIERWRTR